MARSYKKNYSYRKRRKRRTPFPLFLIAGAVILAGFFSVIFAKYAHQETKSDLVAASQFYFTSDLLSEAGKTYTLNPGTTEVEVELRNYEDDLRWTEQAIEYTYSLIKTDGSESKKSGSGTIAAANSTENGGKNSVRLSITGLTAGTYNLSVSSTKPFAKTLTGTFVIPAESTGIQYTVDDSTGSAYALLTISTANYAGKVKISWPENVVPDSTQDALNGVNTWNDSSSSYSAGSVTVNVTANSSYTYRFFKIETSKNYDVNSIKAEKTN